MRPNLMTHANSSLRFPRHSVLLLKRRSLFSKTMCRLRRNIRNPRSSIRHSHNRLIHKLHHSIHNNKDTHKRSRAIRKPLIKAIADRMPRNIVSPLSAKTMKELIM